MKSVVAVVGLLLVASPLVAQAKACEELKAEIETKIKANGVDAFVVEIVASEEAKETGGKKIVGSCEGATKKIVYTQSQASTK